METTLITNALTWIFALVALFGVFGLVMTGLRTADDEQRGRVRTQRPAAAAERRRRDLVGASS
jgi:hypothetical protein